MGSSGGGGGNPGMLMMGGGNPMPGLPVAGQGGGIGDPFKYGKFQNFLPDIKAEGPNDMATGLRPEMFEYRGPDGKVDPSANDQISELRNSLAALQAQQSQGRNQFGAGQGGSAGYGQPSQGFQPLPGQNWYGGPMASS